jgi:hypothetical protein
MENNFSAHLLSDTSFDFEPSMTRVPVRLPWYRSLPMSVVEVASLKIDGLDVMPEKIQLEINGKRFGLPQLPELTEEWWYVLDSAVLHVRDAALRGGNREHTVELVLNLYPPYIPGMTWVTKSTKTVRVN